MIESPSYDVKQNIFTIFNTINIKTIHNYFLNLSCDLEVHSKLLIN